jgi:hypothetical protein
VKNFKLLVSNKYLFRQALGEVIFFPHIIIIYFFIMQTFEVIYVLFFFFGAFNFNILYSFKFLVLVSPKLERFKLAWNNVFNLHMKFWDEKIQELMSFKRGHDFIYMSLI